MGLGPEGAVIFIAIIMIAFFAIILFVYYYDVNKTKKKVLLETFLKILEDSSLMDEDYLVLRDVSKKASKEELLRDFKDMLRLMSLQALKRLKIEKLEVDIYTIYQDIDDIRCKIIKEKEKEKEEGEKRAW